MAPLVGAWLAGTALVYAVLFGVGHLLLHSAAAAVPYAAVARRVRLVGVAGAARSLERLAGFG